MQVTMAEYLRQPVHDRQQRVAICPHLQHAFARSRTERLGERRTPRVAGLRVHFRRPEATVGEQAAEEAARQPRLVGERPADEERAGAEARRACGTAKVLQPPSAVRRGDVLHPHVHPVGAVDDPVGSWRAQRLWQAGRELGAIEGRLAPPIAPARRIDAFVE